MIPTIKASSKSILIIIITYRNKTIFWWKRYIFCKCKFLIGCRISGINSFREYLHIICWINLIYPVNHSKINVGFCWYINIASGHCKCIIFPWLIRLNRISTGICNGYFRYQKTIRGICRNCYRVIYHGLLFLDCKIFCWFISNLIWNCWRSFCGKSNRIASGFPIQKCSINRGVPFCIIVQLIKHSLPS